MNEWKAHILRKFMQLQKYLICDTLHPLSSCSQKTVQASSLKTESCFFFESFKSKKWFSLKNTSAFPLKPKTDQISPSAGVSCTNSYIASDTSAQKRACQFAAKRKSALGKIASFFYSCLSMKYTQARYLTL